MSFLAPIRLESHLSGLPLILGLLYDLGMLHLHRLSCQFLIWHAISGQKSNVYREFVIIIAARHLHFYLLHSPWYVSGVLPLFFDQAIDIMHPLSHDWIQHAF